jgi:hypothetical protein
MTPTYVGVDVPTLAHRDPARHEKVRLAEPEHEVGDPVVVSLPAEPPEDIVAMDLA